jgi:uncharacterized membrane protein
VLFSGELSDIINTSDAIYSTNFWLLMASVDLLVDYLFIYLNTKTGKSNFILLFIKIDFNWCYGLWYQYCHVLAGQVYICLDKHHQWNCKGKKTHQEIRMVLIQYH